MRSGVGLFKTGDLVCVCTDRFTVKRDDRVLGLKLLFTATGVMSRNMFLEDISIGKGIYKDFLFVFFVGKDDLSKRRSHRQAPCKEVLFLRSIKVRTGIRHGLIGLYNVYDHYYWMMEMEQPMMVKHLTLLFLMQYVFIGRYTLYNIHLQMFAVIYDLWDFFRSIRLETFYNH